MAFRGQLSIGAIYDWVLGFILIAAFTKSAQVPFHFWLPNAMEAPTPVSAYLHSATMVQAGVYLLARMSPLLGGTPEWSGLLCTFGGATLLWGALMSLKQTDLKQMLAQSTIASLGLLVILLGLGGEGAAMAVAAYFVAHALYKAGLFLVAGIIDHGTGTRDITALGGLRDNLTITFIAAGLAAVSMFGLPPFLGYFAKEEMYAGMGFGDVWAIATIVILVVGNALLGTVALAVVIRPFMGPLKPTPEAPHEGGFALWIGPARLWAARPCRALRGRRPMARKSSPRWRPPLPAIRSRATSASPSIPLACRSGSRSRPGRWPSWSYWQLDAIRDDPASAGENVHLDVRQGLRSADVRPDPCGWRLSRRTCSMAASSSTSSSSSPCLRWSCWCRLSRSEAGRVCPRSHRCRCTSGASIMMAVVGIITIVVARTRLGRHRGAGHPGPRGVADLPPFRRARPRASPS